MKKLAAIIISVCMAAVSTGCGGSASAAMGNRRIVSIATVQPENHPMSFGLRAMKDYLAQELGDAVEVKIGSITKLVGFRVPDIVPSAHVK